MRTMIFRVAAGMAGLLLATALPASAAPASAALSPAGAAGSAGWRVSTVFSGVLSMTSIVATSGSDAWSGWANAGPTGAPAVVEHWNGSAWRPVPVPSGLVDHVIDPLAVGASSARDMWVFSGTIADPPPVALRWNGTAWRLQQLPRWVIRVSPDPADEFNAQTAVFGPGNVWVFSIGDNGTGRPDHLAARYNGRAWIKVPLPAVPDEVSALAPNDI